MRVVLAVTWLTLKELGRRKIFITLTFFFLALNFSFPHILKGDGTFKGQVQILISYALNFTVFFVAVLNALFGVTVLRREWREKILHLLDVKPAARAQILLGKYLGLMVLNVCLLVVVYASLSINLSWLVEPVDGRDKASITLAKDQVLTSRRAVVHRFTDQMKEQIMSNKKTYSVEKGKTYRWDFDGIKVPEGVKTLSLKYKFYSTTTSDSFRMQVLWLIGDPTKGGGFIRRQTNNAVNLSHELIFPASLVKSGEPLTVQCLNIPTNNKTLLFPFIDGMSVLLKDSSFELNLAKAFVVLFFQLALLAAIAIACTTFLSSPVSLMCVLTVYLLLLSGGLLQSLSSKPVLPTAQEKMLSKSKNKSFASVAFDSYSKIVARVAKFTVPDYIELSPVGYVSKGMSLSSSLVWIENALFQSLRCLVVLLFGIWIFSTRELAAIKD